MPYRPKDPEKYRNEEWLREKYRVEKLSTAEIGDLCDCSKETIRRWLDRHGIEKRSKSEAAKVRAERYPETIQAGAEALREHGVNAWEYWDEEEREAFRNRLSEERTGEGNPMNGVYGADHHLWKEDAEYPTVYHTPEWVRTRKQVYERDNFTCHICRDRSAGPLHAHHRTPISEGGDPFDLSNLVTLCESCHYAVHA